MTQKKFHSHCRTTDTKYFYNFVRILGNFNQKGFTSKKMGVANGKRDLLLYLWREHKKEMSILRAGGYNTSPCNDKSSGKQAASPAAVAMGGACRCRLTKICFAKLVAWVKFCVKCFKSILMSNCWAKGFAHFHCSWVKLILLLQAIFQLVSMKHDTRYSGKSCTADAAVIKLVRLAWPQLLASRRDRSQCKLFIHTFMHVQTKRYRRNLYRHHIKTSFHTLVIFRHIFY